MTDKEILISLGKAVDFCSIQQNSEENMYENISCKVKEREDQTVQEEFKKGASLTQVGIVFNSCKNNHVSIYQCRQKNEGKNAGYTGTAVKFEFRVRESFDC